MTVDQGLDLGNILLQALGLLVGVAGGFAAGRKTATVQKAKLRDERKPKSTGDFGTAFKLGGNTIEIIGDNPEHVRAIEGLLKGIDPRSLP